MRAQKISCNIGLVRFSVLDWGLGLALAYTLFQSLAIFLLTIKIFLLPKPFRFKIPNNTIKKLNVAKKTHAIYLYAFLSAHCKRM